MSVDVKDSTATQTTTCIYLCDGCRHASPPVSAPIGDRAACDKQVCEKHHWRGQGERWECPVCRVGALTVTPVGDGVRHSLFAPADLRRDIHNLLGAAGIGFDLDRDAIDGQDLFTFPKGVTDAQVKEALRAWPGTPYVNAMRMIRYSYRVVGQVAKRLAGEVKPGRSTDHSHRIGDKWEEREGDRRWVCLQVPFFENDDFDDAEEENGWDEQADDWAKDHFPVKQVIDEHGG